MTEPTSTPADKADKHPSPILRGWRDGATTVLLFAHDLGAKTHGHGFVNTGTGNRNVIFFFNEKDGKKSITLKEFVPANGGEGGGQWNVVGFGHALNQRKDDKQVFFDTVLFNVDGKVLEARITRAGEAFRDQIGFTQARIERPKEQAQDAPSEQDAEPAAAYARMGRG